jgi:hypothetical protein
MKGKERAEKILNIGLVIDEKIEFNTLIKLSLTWIRSNEQ